MAALGIIVAIWALLACRGARAAIWIFLAYAFWRGAPPWEQICIVVMLAAAMAWGLLQAASDEPPGGRLGRQAGVLE